MYVDGKWEEDGERVKRMYVDGKWEEDGERMESRMEGKDKWKGVEVRDGEAGLGDDERRGGEDEEQRKRRKGSVKRR
ncbi:hypothetical protein Pmani_020236 [Petrolisthes manimaculis]|uniref:Uncharacterized protein n=1 Tax=Petrolisthes manimaculis TaxID=1843537 RepID=A0AAE1U4N7_9EUCA|nr:hypothetical protein Pmani_020236 [Petrolisthes manimaculis]